MTIRFIIKQKGLVAGSRSHGGKPASFRTPLYIRLRDGRAVDWTLRTEILVFPAWWDPKREEVKPLCGCSEEERISVNTSVISLRNRIVARYVAGKAQGRIGPGWLRCELIAASGMDLRRIDLDRLFGEFYFERSLSVTRIKQYEVVHRAIVRFESYITERACVPGVWPDSSGGFDGNAISKLSQFLQVEHRIRYIDGHPQRQRSLNTINDMLRKVRAFSNWCVRRGYIKQSPFANYHIESEVYGTPVCLTPEEVRRIAEYRPSSPGLERQRDIFVFQCNIGCRVCDLMHFRQEDCDGERISYIPTKTVRTFGGTVTVPLNDVAKEIIAKYKDSCSGSLLPFISVQRYNDAIKRVLREAGITRMVTVLDPVSRTGRRVRVCDIASSHMARRTFINSIYHKVKDPALVASLTGHSEGSRAFSRYRTIDDEMKVEMVKILECPH